MRKFVEQERKTKRKSKTGVPGVEKLHPAHCIEIQEKEKLRRKRDAGTEGWRREKERARQGGRRVRKDKGGEVEGWRTGRQRARAARFWSRRDAENSVPI